jgi:hypothetical protein
MPEIGMLYLPEPCGLKVGSKYFTKENQVSINRKKKKKDKWRGTDRSRCVIQGYNVQPPPPILIRTI